MPSTSKLQKKRELYRLIIARDSVNSALDAVDTAIKLNVESGHPLFSSLFHAVVSSYGRAFTEMKPFGSISSKWTRFNTPERQKVHDMLMLHRDKTVAHTDYIPEKVMIYPPNATRHDGSKSEMVSFEVLTQYYAPNAYAPIAQLCEDLGNRLQEAINDLLKDLYDGGHALTEKIELMTHQDIDQLNG